MKYYIKSQCVLFRFIWKNKTKHPQHFLVLMHSIHFTDLVVLKLSFQCIFISPKMGKKEHHAILENTRKFNFPGELYWSADKGETKSVPAKVTMETEGNPRKGCSQQVSEKTIWQDDVADTRCSWDQNLQQLTFCNL